MSTSNGAASDAPFDTTSDSMPSLSAAHTRSVMTFLSFAAIDLLLIAWLIARPMHLLFVGFLFATVALVLIHEGGHAVAALGHGVRIKWIVIGPFRFMWTPTGQLVICFERRISLFGGAICPDIDRSSPVPFRTALWIFAGGPLASVGAGALAFVAALAVRTLGLPSWYHLTLNMLGLATLGMGVATALPFSFFGRPNDGLKFWRLLRAMREQRG